MNLILTDKEVIEIHESLKFDNESSPITYRCDQMDLSGILSITNLRISFYYKNNSDELVFNHYLFNLIDKIKFYPNSRTNIVEINHDYEWTTFIFRSKMNTSEFKFFLEKSFPNKIEISEHIKDSPMKNKTFEKEEKPETEFKEKKRLFEFESQDSLKKIFVSLLLYSLKIGGVILVLYFASLFFPKFGDQISKTINYPSYWLNVQRCEKDMFTISSKMNFNNEYPTDLTTFILKHFKITGNNNPAKDPWGSLYDIDYDNNNFKLISYGPDKIENTNDDITKIFAKINK